MPTTTTVSPPPPPLDVLQALATRASAAALLNARDRGRELLRRDELVEARALLAGGVEDEDRGEADDVVLLLETLGFGGIVIGGVDLDRDETGCLLLHL